MGRFKRATMTALAAILAALFAAQAVAVEPGLPSKTSILIAALRALTSHDPDPLIRNPDWLAERFIGPRERAMIPDHWSIQALTVPYVDAMRLGPVAEVSRAALIRTRFIDERLEAAVRAGAQQVVILGAGFDSRAYRLRDLLAKTKVIEVDYGPTQEYKKQRVREVLGDVPKNLVFASIDFTKDKLTTVLRRAGYRDKVRTFIIWEGVSFYIPEAAVRSTLGELSKLAAPGSAMAIDFMTKTYVEGDAKNPRTTPAGFPEWGEPWIFGIADGTEDRFFNEGGFTLVKKLSLSGGDAEVDRLYLTRRDGTVFGPPSGKNVAFMSRLSGQPGYWIAELAVKQ